MSMPEMVRRRFDVFTVCCFILGACSLAAAGAVNPASGAWQAFALLAIGAVAALAAAAGYAMRFMVADWRPQRTNPKSRFMAYVVLLALPGAFGSGVPWLAPAIAAALPVGLLTFYACEEAFTRGQKGFLSRRAQAFSLVGIVWILLLGRPLLTWLGLFGESVMDWPVFAPLDLPVDEAHGFAQLYGSMLLLPLPCMVAMAELENRPLARCFWLASAAAAAIGIALSFSRAAWLGLGAEILALAILYRGRVGGWILAAGALAALAAALLVPGAVERFASMFNPWHATNIQRLQQWRVALDLLAESPFIGHGWGSFGALYATRAGTYYHWPHNLPLHIAMEGGLMALVLFFAWIMELRSVINRDYGSGPEARLKTAFRNAAVATVAGLLMFGMFDW